MSTHLEKFRFPSTRPSESTHTQQHQKERRKTNKNIKNNAPAKVCSAVQQQTTPAMNAKHHRISFATKK